MGSNMNGVKQYYLPSSGVNECLNGGCRHGCCNTIGSFYCKFHPGFTHALDKRSCHGNQSCFCCCCCCCRNLLVWSSKWLGSLPPLSLPLPLSPSLSKPLPCHVLYISSAVVHRALRVFIELYLSVCLSNCLSVCLSVSVWVRQKQSLADMQKLRWTHKLIGQKLYSNHFITDLSRRLQQLCALHAPGSRKSLQHSHQSLCQCNQSLIFTLIHAWSGFSQDAFQSSLDVTFGQVASAGRGDANQRTSWCNTPARGETIKIVNVR